MIKSKKFIMISMFIFILFLVGCKEIRKEENELDKIVIAEQYGLAYAPLTLAKEMNLFEKNFENEIEWIKLGNTMAIREAMLSEDLDIGFMGIPPFLIGYDNGMEWNVFTGLSEAPIGLVTKKDGVFSIKDIKENDKIVLPQPGSIQHILLSMASEKEFSDAKKFDNQIVTMNHQDGLSAMISNTDINYHFTSPPYIFEELKIRGSKNILSGKEAVGGDFTFIVGVARKNFINSNIEELRILKETINEAISIIKNDKKTTLNILEKAYSIDRKILEEYLYMDDMKFSNNIKGMDIFLKFMYENNYLKNEYEEGSLIFNGE